MNEERIVNFLRSEKGGISIFLALMLFALIYGLRSSSNKSSVLQAKGKITSSVVTKEGITGNHSYIYYEYKVYDKVYKARSKYIEGVKIPGGRYIVVYDPDDPIVHVILYAREIQDRLGEAIDYEVSNDEIKKAVWQLF